MKRNFFRKLQNCLPQHVVSAWAGKLASCRWTWVKNSLIKIFMRSYSVSLTEALRETPDQYDNFNDFFTRRLKPQLRPITADGIASPVDGCVSELGILDGRQLLQAKGRLYDVATLLGDTVRAEPFYQGAFLTAYLAPRDYHRIHMPVTGRLLEMVYIPGHLFSVNALAVLDIPNLFSQNERVVCFFETEMGLMAVVMVGALLVGSIATSWHGTVVPMKKRSITHWDYRASQLHFEKGQEIGYFQFGSTVIVLFPAAAKVVWEEHLKPMSIVQMGGVIGAFKMPTPAPNQS
jgi:phosphatidylserine decarboxylase